MQKIGKNTINKVGQSSDVVGDSNLEFKLEGPNIDYIVSNTIRRTILSDIPIYAFNEFKFEKNTSVLHNDYLKLRFRHMPVWTIENTVDFIDPTQKNTVKIDEENEDEDNDNNVELEVEKSMNVSTLKQLTMYVSYKNKTNEIVNVSTADAKFYYEEKQIASPYKVPIPLARLQPMQEIAFSATTNIGTEQENAMYCAVCIATYKEVNDHEYIWNIESRGQITEKRILQVALINIDRQLKNFMKSIKEQKLDKTDADNVEGVIIVNNEDNTLGNLIARGMQMHKSILFAGYNLPHPRVKKVHFHYKHEKGANIIKIIDDVVDYYLELFTNIKSQIDKNL